MADRETLRAASAYLREQATLRFGSHGPHDARGAAFWDAAAGLDPDDGNVLGLPTGTAGAVIADEIPDGAPVFVVVPSVGVPIGTSAVARHKSPTGQCNLPTVYWLEQGREKGFWAGRGEFVVAGVGTPYPSG